MVEEKTKKIVRVPGTGRNMKKQKVLPRESPSLRELTPRIVSETIAGIQEAIRENYVFPEQAEDLCRALEAHHANHDYDQTKDSRAFCEQVTRHLRDVVDDKHMQVMLPGDIPSICAPAVKKSDENKGAHLDVTRGGILPGNIGYINITMFNPLPDSEGRLEDAMQSVKNTDALVFDLRKCRGGSADSANFLLSYFFKAPLTLLETYFRPQNHTLRSQTTETPFKYTKPVYVLTSGFTGSCGEHFAFAMKIHKRATLVGTNTAGMAHPVAFIGLDTGIMFKVPIGRTYNPKTNEDWEGTGVSPDIRCSEDDALKEAQKDIHSRSVTKTTDEGQR